MSDTRTHNKKLWLGLSIGVALGVLVSRKLRFAQPHAKEDDQLVIGFRDEWKRFGERNPIFLQSMPLLFNSIDVLFKSTVTMDNLADRVVYFLAKIAAEDFTEVFILCGNGHGIGGLKILRGMYERIVTLTYIANNPDKAEAFWNYHMIHKYKMLVHAERAGIQFAKELVDATKAARDLFKDNYMDACDSCGVKTPLPSWVKGGMDTMNAGTTKELRQRYFYCYYWPTLHDHATPNNIIERLKEGEGGSLEWKEDAQRGWADVSVSSAHSLLISILELSNSRFQLGMEQRIDRLWDDWKKAWINTPPTPPEV